MYLVETDQNCKSHDEISEKPSNNRAVRQIARRFALTIPHAREVVALAGLGSEEARR